MISAEKFWDRQSRRFDREHKNLESLYSKILQKIKQYVQAHDVV